MEKSEKRETINGLIPTPTETTSSMDTDKMMQDVVELSLLYDFYSDLLGDHKKKIFGDYVMNDLSLSEIAEEAGISRQGVHDIIKRCARQLREYEEKLHLRERFQKVKASGEEIKQITRQLSMTDNSDIRKQLAGRIETITNELVNQI